MRNCLRLLVCIIVVILSCNSIDKRPDLPIITSVSPRGARVGESITLSGNNFEIVSKVNFGGLISVAPSFSAAGQLRVDVPRVPVGPTVIRLESSAGNSETVSFEVLKSIATITAIVPNRAKRGESVTISGENLDLVTGVRFSNDSSSAAKFTHDGSSLKVIVPEDAISGKVYVSNLEGKAVSSEDFKVIVRPEILSLSSDYGVGNAEIEIVGKYLENAFVYFDTVKVVPISNNGLRVRVRCPKFIDVGRVNLRIKTDGGEAVHSFTGAPASVISMAIPNGIIPGSALTLKGKNFFDVQEIVLPGGGKIARIEFLSIKSNEVTIKLPESASGGDFQVVSQYGAGESLRISFLNGGGGLNGDNIANGPTGIGSVGALSRPCNPFTIKDYYIAFYPENSTIPKPPLPSGPTFEGIFSGLLYSICYCGEKCGTSGCFDPLTNQFFNHCFDENDENYFYGTFEKLGKGEYRRINGSSACRATEWTWAEGGHWKCEREGVAFAFNVSILIELDRKGTTIERDVYTGFMIVRLYQRGSSELIETYFGNRTRDDEYILESSSGNHNRLKIKLTDF